MQSGSKNMLPLLLLLFVSPIFGLPASPEEEDYDLEEVVGLYLNDTVLVHSDEADEKMIPFEEAGVTNMLTEIEQLRNKIGEKEEEVEQLHSQIDSDKN